MKKAIFILFIVSLFSSCTSTKTENKTVSQNSTTSKVAVQNKSKEQLEYERATKDLFSEVVSIDTYEKDKKIILGKIAELNVIMQDKNYKSWLNYIERNSINYWSQKTNLASASKQLPVKGIKLNSLEDYFRFVFIPSRVGRNIDEIRYVSSTSIKAVQIRNDETIIFYNFKKINNDWFVELPRL